MAGREVAVITHVTVLIVTGFKENKTCSGGKKGGVAKIYSGESAMKWKSKNLRYIRW